MTWSAPDVAFLGVCDRATEIPAGPFTAHSMLNLSPAIFLSVFPFDIKGLTIALAMYCSKDLQPADIQALGPDGLVLFSIHIDMAENATRRSKVNRKRMSHGTGASIETLVPSTYATWSTLVISLDMQVVVMQPGQYTIVLRRGQDECTIGCLNIAYTLSPELTPDRIAAIRSDPNAANFVRYQLECQQCGGRLSAYAGLESSQATEDEGFVWYTKLPTRFRCTCGKLDVDVSILRQNLHALLGRRMQTDGGIAWTQLYEQGALRAIHTELRTLVNTKPQEEEVQQFIQKHPTLLHAFSPVRIFYKTPILSKYKTDITILTASKELLLIEIERPDRRLLTKSGEVAAELQHPINQVHDWLHEAEEHRVALLDCLGLRREDVGLIRGVVITGRDAPYRAEDLRKLRKQVNTERVTFRTYDDLLDSMDSLASSIEGL